MENKYHNLVRHYSNLFDDWFDKKTFPEEDYCYLAEKCYEYRDIWNIKGIL